MHASVLAKWHEFSTPMEGRVHSMYLDVKKLITTGVGNLIDRPEDAARLPWKMPDGSLATKSEIVKQWHALKAQPDLAKLHWKYAAKVTTIRLTDEDIDALVESVLLTNVKHMRKAFPDWDEFPADGQLGCLSMAWAVGAGFPGIFKNFTKYANQQDWIAAKACSKIKTAGNPGVVPRNRNNELCFDNSATVRDLGLDPTELHWPNVAPLTRVPFAARPDAAADLKRAAVHAQSLQFDTLASVRAEALDELKGE